MSERQKVGDLITCWQCGEKFVFTRLMTQGRKYCRRDCYKDACRRFHLRPYPEVWHNGKKIYLHRLIWIEANPDEELLPDDIIHHRDDNPFNRDPSNLERLTGDARVEHLRRHNFNRQQPAPPAYDDDDEIPF